MQQAGQHWRWYSGRTSVGMENHDQRGSTLPCQPGPELQGTPGPKGQRWCLQAHVQGDYTKKACQTCTLATGMHELNLTP